jgi:hypothetical protein
MKDHRLDIVEGSAPFKMEKREACRVGARNMGALAAQDGFGPHRWEKEKLWMMVIHLD